MSPLTQRSFALDFIRAFAILGVVAIHLSYPIYARPDFAGGTTWWIAQSINAVSRISIPLFIMLSGYLLLVKDEGIGKTLSRTGKRIVVPLIFWTIFYTFWDGMWNKNEFAVDSSLQAMISGGGHLYFLYIMFGLYLLLPLFRKTWAHATQELRQYLVLLTLLFGLLFTALQYFYSHDTTSWTFLVRGFPFVGFFLAGAYLGDLKLSDVQWRGALVVWALATVFTAVMGLLTLQWYLQGNELFWDIVPYFDNYLSLNVVIAALSAFLVLKNSEYHWIQGSVWGKATQVVSGAALGLYVVHFLVMDLVDSLPGFQVDFMESSLLEYFVKRSVLVFTGALAIVLMIKATPVLKKSLGE